MLDVRFVRKNLDLVRQALADRRTDLDLEGFAKLDEKRRAVLTEVESLKNERNASSAEVAKLKRAGQDATELLEKLSGVSERIKALDEEARQADEASEAFLLSVPNLPHATTPVGKDETDNPVVRVWGEKPDLVFPPREHWDLGQALNGLDFERAGRMTGSRFAVLWGWAARLERALAAFMLDVHTRQHGYTEVAPPLMVNADTLRGTGQLPKFEGDLFKTNFKDFYLIPTAEVPLTNLHRDETLDEERLPLGYCAHTPCFRSEAGSYGKDTKGLIRQHQFSKVELVRFARPEESYEQLELLTAHAEKILQLLGLHYRVISLCTGDLGFSSAKTYDIEVWLPGQNAYREISSCSNCEDFQARRAGIRCKAKGGKARLAHTLNGSGLAVGRTMVAVLENGQQADGSIVLPEALVPYMGGVSVIEP
ncbi:Serine--tRNA ligase [Fundidesulfovibrio magnetotacticus]|uniref:Serine--tRNA ligase n=1 Tax=Fundidesulfovibrio magnetotacticus TaxID=2730080 RepID=A0A6V8LWQ5_9BACT|nr:serine--tRNA ligase [Fundidesulfovibrio magnetotacticus]GFK94097.1 Serine--tRNA ligase [Fundidesulfovibrio magnetotacticus]